MSCPRRPSMTDIGPQSNLDSYLGIKIGKEKFLHFCATSEQDLIRQRDIFQLSYSLEKQHEISYQISNRIFKR